ncbi:MAG: rhodanese-like domain-containing protein [Acidobacteria bacterium]|nr:rhodanese-like domain-containing protein [Acidobacteriota bacterium]
MRRRRRIVLALCAVTGVVAAAGWASGCAAVGRWLQARKARQSQFRVVSAPVASEIVRDAPDVFILDLRSPEEFQGPKGHLRNALNLPLARLPYRLLEIRSYRGETFLVYCDGDDCGRSGMRILQDSGFQDAVLIAGGIDGWIRAGFTTFVRASTLHPPHAEIKTVKHPELVRDRPKPMDEVPVVPPKEPPGASPPTPKPPGAPPPPSASPPPGQ